MNFLALAVVAMGSLVMAFVFRWLRLPLWPMTGGVVGAAAVNLGFNLSVQAPNILILIAQVIIGASIGATIGPEIFRQFLKILIPGTLAVSVTLSAGLLFGWTFARLDLMPLEESMFSLVPGGVSELVTASVAIGLDGAVIIGGQLVRLFTVVWSLPILLWAAEKIYKRWVLPPDAEPEPQA